MNHLKAGDSHEISRFVSLKLKKSIAKVVVICRWYCLQTFLSQIRNTKLPAFSGSNLFNILMIILKEFFKKFGFEKISRTLQKTCKLTQHSKSQIVLWGLINSLPAIGEFHHPLITFANSLDPDQDRQNVGPDLDPNCLILWLSSWKNFSKKSILKIVSRWPKQRKKITQRAKS